MLVCYCGYATQCVYTGTNWYTGILYTINLKRSFEENGLKMPDLFICYNHYQLLSTCKI